MVMGPEITKQLLQLERVLRMIPHSLTGEDAEDVLRIMPTGIYINPYVYIHKHIYIYMDLYTYIFIWIYTYIYIHIYPTIMTIIYQFRCDGGWLLIPSSRY
jgi:hypothetical protein